MIIQTNKSIHKYTSTQVLDLMRSPSPDSDMQLYQDYYNFINAIDAIYATQEKNGNIPVFRTKSDTISDSIIPDPDSTLRFLIPNESYLFIINSDSYLPLKIPNPIGLTEFVSNIQQTTKNISCCPFILTEVSDAIIDDESGSAYIIRASISGMISNEKYTYQITPVFSNWPAKLSPSSGDIVVPSEPDSEGRVSGHIESILSYYENLTDNLHDSIPYTINKIANNIYYNKNIYSIVNLSIFNNKCTIYDKNIIIRCKSCVDNHKCPNISLTSSGSGPLRFVTASLNNLEYNTEYRYEFTTDSSNLNARISPISGIISKGIDQTSSVLHAAFKYCELSEPDCNLPSTIPNSYTDPAISANIYTNLILNLYPIGNNYCDNILDNVLIECNRCFESNNYRTSIKFDKPSYRITGPYVGLPYPTGLGDGYPGVSNDRPNSEYNLYTSGLNNPCCVKPAVLQLVISNAISGDKYTYDFTSYPDITIIPSTGIVSFGASSGVISVLGYLESQKSSSVHVVLTHEKSNQKSSDSVIIRCPEPW